MFEQSIHNLNMYLNLHPEMAGWVGFCVAFIESLAIIGTIVPSALTFFPLGFLIGKGVIPKTNTFVMICLGALIGDYLSYIVGLKGKKWLEKKKILIRYQDSLEKGKQFFTKYGMASILIGRFIGPLRSSIPFFAGIMEMQQRYFLIAVMPTVLLWAFVYLIPGYMVGAFAMNLTMHSAYIFCLYSMILISLYAMAHRRSRLRMWLTYALFAAKQKENQLMRFQQCIFSLIIWILFTCAVLLTKNIHDINESIWFFLQSIRTPSLDILCLRISEFAWKKSLIPACISLSLILFLYSRMHRSILFTIHAIGAAASIHILKHLIAFPRPAELQQLISFSYPSGHVGLLTFLVISMHCLTINRPSIQKVVRWVGSTIIILTIFSRIYLGYHWLTDVIGGFTLGCFWGHSFEYFMVEQKDHQKKWAYTSMIIVLIPTLTALIISIIVHSKDNDHLNKINQQIERYVEQKNTPNWILFNRFHEPSGIFNLQWNNSTITSIENTLVQNNWLRVDHPTGVFNRLFEQFTQDKHMHLALFSQLRFNQYPILTMKQNHQTLKLWADKKEGNYTGYVSKTDPKTHIEYWSTLALNQKPEKINIHIIQVDKSQIEKRSWAKNWDSTITRITE